MDVSVIPNIENEKHICTECYELGSHSSVSYDNWRDYLIRLAIIGPLIIIPSILYAIIIFCFFLVSALFNRGLPDSHAMIRAFPLFDYLPEPPHTVKTCPHCGKVNTEAKIKDHNGQVALHFHIQTGMHLRNEKPVQPQERPAKQKHDPEEF